MEAAARDEATGLVGRLAAGDQRAADDLFPLVYAELHALAEGVMKDRRAGHTLQPTALVSEAYLRLVAAPPQSGWNGRLHFLGVAAKAMRSVLIDHARRKSALRRGGSAERLQLEGLLEAFEERSSDLVALDAALEKLAAQDSELGRLVELRFFGGLTMEDVAAALGTSVPTATRRWRVARMWLQRELGA
jgi:RNA polymerase sigma factor (TIGR02999 family)